MIGSRKIMSPRAAGMGKRDAESELHAPPDKGRHLNQELQDTPDENTDGKRSRGVLKMTPDDPYRKKNCRDIQKDRGGSGQTKNVKAVEDAHGQRRQSDKKQIREDDAVEINGLTAGHIFAREQLNNRG